MLAVLLATDKIKAKAEEESSIAEDGEDSDSEFSSFSFCPISNFSHGIFFS